MALSSQQLSFRTSPLRKLAAGVAATTVVVGGIVALTPGATHPAPARPASPSGALVDGWSTRTGGVLAGHQLSVVTDTSGASVDGWSTRTAGVLAGHILISDTSGAYVDGWSTRTGGVLASQHAACPDPHGAYVDGWSTRTGGHSAC